ncbi:MAG: Shikimate dehydrogenase [Candidatus Magnetoglobus multicellularis str. Araruama]|uniref:Shikimate dehydrogenase (NADP(+)) n=1 Tax=Candidatus Magnetoglobus multicellularis str. Araruama TaxID=890399 RepID=A0A1V1P032_9BACT|nr:MAG: Shikimate dehydrogenase [Candidatus Magnetoglobus multicellularis str. Araruama]
MSIIDCHTQVCAVIGNPVEHSLSPAIHNAAFEHLNLNYVYVACPVENVSGAMAGMRAFKNFRGMSVTIPHKIEVMKHVDDVALVDRNIGSINTVIHEQDRLIGLGTDGAGALKALADNDVEIDGKNILMLGAGGASRAISFTLAQKSSLKGLSILDIDDAQLKNLNDDLKTGTDTPINSRLMSEQTLDQEMEKADVIIHCTPIGMHPKVDASLIPPELFRTGQVVFDIVYTPLETKLLADARSRGLKVIQGVEMFINQAALQFEKFTGVDAPVEVMRRVVMENLKS